MTSVPPSIRGGIQMFVPPAAGSVLAARLELSANWPTPSGSVEYIPWDVVVFDDLGVTASRAGAFTLQADGLYLIESNVQIGVGGVGIRDALITMNGTTDIAIGQIAYPTGFIADGAWFSISSGVNKYHAGDWFEVGIQSDAGEDVDGPAPYNNFTIIKFG